MMEYAYIDCGTNDDEEGLKAAFANVGPAGAAADAVKAIAEAWDEAREEDGEDAFVPSGDMINGPITRAYVENGCEVLVIDYELDNGFIVVVRY